MQWITHHGEAISALTGLGTLAVWMVYLQVFVSSYRRQLRATLLITRGPGAGLGARCFLSNMSAGPVYIASVQVEVETAREAFGAPVTDNRALEAGTTADPHQRTRQGPLRDGETRDIGSFEELLRHACRDSAAALPPTEDQLRSITIEVVGLYGSEDLPIGARRCFVVCQRGGRPAVQGKELRTEQIRSGRSRRRLLADLGRDP